MLLLNNEMRYFEKSKKARFVEALIFEILDAVVIHSQGPQTSGFVGVEEILNTTMTQDGWLR